MDVIGSGPAEIVTKAVSGLVYVEELAGKVK